MRYNKNARLDTSGVEDTRGDGGGSSGAGAGGGLIGVLLGSILSGKRGGALGGGAVGIIGLVLYLVLSGGGGGSGGGGSSILDQLGQSGQPAAADNAEVSGQCRTGADANDKLECAVVADIDSIQDYWAATLPSLGKTYTKVPTVWFSGRVTTGCGAADSGAGPFYCPADRKVYIDLTFYNDLHSKFGAEGGLFVDAYVLAHEYGHHVQDLLGTEARVRTRSGPTSDSVRLELQADCYAGVWAQHATQLAGGEQPLIAEITPDDISRALDTAGRIGDDYIQRNLGGGQVDRSTFTHGSSAQRRKWFSTGYQTGNPRACDTFGATNLG